MCLPSRGFAFRAFLTVLFLLPSRGHTDTSIAVIDIAGIVPAIFSVTLTSQPNQVDLSPGVFVSNLNIGDLHFRYNENVQALTVSSSTSSGLPENSSGAAYQFGGSGTFKVSFQNTCSTVDSTYYVPFSLTSGGTDVKSAASGSLTTTGVDEHCQIYATYQGTTTTMPLAGTFDMKILLTMVSI